MIKPIAILIATASLALGGCATVQPFADAGIKAVEANPSLIPCLASQAALVAAGVLGPKGSSIRKTNRQTVRISQGLCEKLGGTPMTTTAAK